MLYRKKQSCNILDMGKKPYIVDIKDLAKCNTAYRAALWTGNYLQTTLMSIKAGGDIGLEMHPEVDQFIMVVDGHGTSSIGESKDKLTYSKKVGSDDAIYIPAGSWHNVVNTGNQPLKLISFYAPPNHPSGTYQETKEDAQHSKY